MKIKWKNGKKEYWITEFVSTVTWSGADTQASRSLEFEMVNTPFDKSMSVPVLKGGDIVNFYDDNGKCRFEGRITGKNKLSEVGTRQYTARDYMHNMVKSKASYIFKKKTAEYITKAICKDMGITPLKQDFDLECHLEVRVRLAQIEAFRKQLDFCQINIK